MVKRLSRDVYEIAGQACFFTIRCAPGPAPFERPGLARIAVDCLLGQQAKSSCQLHVYCVMPDHVHLVVSPLVQGASTLEYVDRFKGWSSRLLHQAGWKGEVWQKRSYDHVLRKAEDFHKIAEYILANPVRKGLVEDPADYPWSGIVELLRKP